MSQRLRVLVLVGDLRLPTTQVPGPSHPANGRGAWMIPLQRQIAADTLFQAYGYFSEPEYERSHSAVNVTFRRNTARILLARALRFD